MPFYQNFTPCSGIFFENGDTNGKHVPDLSDMEVLPAPSPGCPELQFNHLLLCKFLAGDNVVVLLWGFYPIILPFQIPSDLLARQAEHQFSDLDVPGSNPCGASVISKILLSFVNFNYSTLRINWRSRLILHFIQLLLIRFVHYLSYVTGSDHLESYLVG